MATFLQILQYSYKMLYLRQVILTFLMFSEYQIQSEQATFDLLRTTCSFRYDARLPSIKCESDGMPLY